MATLAYAVVIVTLAGSMRMAGARVVALMLLAFVAASCSGTGGDTSAVTTAPTEAESTTTTKRNGSTPNGQDGAAGCDALSDAEMVQVLGSELELVENVELPRDEFPPSLATTSVSSITQCQWVVPGAAPGTPAVVWMQIYEPGLDVLSTLLNTDLQNGCGPNGGEQSIADGSFRSTCNFEALTVYVEDRDFAFRVTLALDSPDDLLFGLGEAVA